MNFGLEAFDFYLGIGIIIMIFIYIYFAEKEMKDEAE